MQCSRADSTAPDRAVSAFVELGIGTPETLRTLSRKEHKATYLIECEATFYVVSCYDEANADAIKRRDCALAHMRHCAALDLAPQPLQPLSRATHGNAIIYAFIEGVPISSYRDLASAYGSLGTFAARLHGSVRSDQGVVFPSLMDRFQSVVVKESVRAKAAHLDEVARGRSLLLHGDVNGANVIAAQSGMIALDFDETGHGPAELELAIAVAYVNTCGQDVHECYVALRDSYCDAGGCLDEELLKPLIQIAPWYFLSSQMRGASSSCLPAEIICAVETQCEFLSNAVPLL